MNLKLSAPQEITWWIAVALGVLGILVNAGILSIGLNAFWFVAAAFVILAVATLVRNL